MFQKILVPLDGSPLGEAVLPLATEVARRHGGELILLRVAPVHALPGMHPRDAQLLSVREAEEYLSTVEEEFQGRGLRVAALVRCGDPATEILDEGLSGGADLIVMSTHGHTGIRRWALGSVAEKVLRAAQAPLLLVRAPGAEG